MHELQATATFALGQPGDDTLTAIFARSVLEAALAEEDDAELWLEVEDDAGARRLAVDVSHRDLDEILHMVPGDEIGLSLGGETVECLFEDAEVEAHGLKLPLAIVVSSAAILTPAGQAAVTQVVGTETAAQRSSPALATEARPGARAEVVGIATRTEVARTLVVRANGIHSVRATLVR